MSGESVEDKAIALSNDMVRGFADAYEETSALARKYAKIGVMNCLRWEMRNLIARKKGKRHAMRRRNKKVMQVQKTKRAHGIGMRRTWLRTE